MTQLAAQIDSQKILHSNVTPQAKTAHAEVTAFSACNAVIGKGGATAELT